MDRLIFERGISELGFDLDERKMEKFEKFSSLLVEWNEKMNLTAVTDPEGISVKHFLDSIAPLSAVNFKEGARVIDVGTGAGFPGIPIRIVRDDLNFTFLDSLNKRINFLNEVSKELSFENVEFVHGRAEEAGKDKRFREKYDYAVSRAVANMKVLCEYCLPFVKVGGAFAAFKQFEVDDEISDAKAMIGSLGGAVCDIKEVKIPQSDIVRKIVIVEKVKETPSQFPRRANKIKK
ncbi:MAG: 16S rRNA (guanine(527)-N(7))-methyltransferase RsmG [Ruminococcaceae bacterium]|nr:16S rRNA (guanine(527)-N(7))-methyltransferase RsmG [Oscillospiraceae bacterium]